MATAAQNLANPYSSKHLTDPELQEVFVDIVTKNLINSFRKEQALSADLETSTLFEHFANFCVVSLEYAEEFEVEEILVAGSNDLQLDGIGIIVNGVLVTSKDEVDDLAQMNRQIDAEFIFIQAKSGKGFDGAEISNAFYGIRELLSDSPVHPRNDSLAAKEEIIRRIYDKSAMFRNGNPKVTIYYITLGKWEDDAQLKSRITNEIQTLEQLNIFRSGIIFKPVGARGVQEMYHQARNSLSKTISFDNRVLLPANRRVKEAYLGFLPANAYINMLCDDSGSLLRGLFYENVRDFQGDNPVNKEIEESLRNDQDGDFVLLNNGITIVSAEVSVTANLFTLTGFQIVNGCQTSHVLYNNKDKLHDKIYVPVKLIVAPQEELQNKVIKATNRQTMVKTEELAALTDFQKSLERYYDAVDKNHRLYYERRSQQFRSVTGIEKIRIVSISTQIRAFASMFLDRAHLASRYYGTLLKDTAGAIFQEGHDPAAYYVSAYALFRVESALRRKELDSKFRPFKYHFLAILRRHLNGEKMPVLASNKFMKYCEKIQMALWDSDSIDEEIHRVAAALDTVLGGKYERDRAKDASLSEKAATAL